MRLDLSNMWINAQPGARIEAPLGKRIAVFVYAVACYGMFFLTFLYAAGFVGNFLVPKSIDSPRVGPLWWALAVDIGLLLVFSVQHSVMARPAFKRWWTRFVPEPAERATYVLFSNLALIALFVFWQPIGGVVWDVQQPVVRGVLYGLFAIGWLLVLVSTFVINHFDLFGLRQGWLYLRGRAYTHLKFATPGMYSVVRHPLYVGWLIGFWATPTMTASHLLFALLTTGYILTAIRFEERDLASAHPEYEAYRRRVPMLVPRLRKAKALGGPSVAVS